MAQDIVDWLRDRRDAAAAQRRKLFAEIEQRNGTVTSGVAKPDDVALPNQQDLLAANQHDADALNYYIALIEIEISRHKIAEMTKALKERQHYTPDESSQR